jgi:hypothetical protein
MFRDPPPARLDHAGYARCTVYGVRGTIGLKTLRNWAYFRLSVNITRGEALSNKEQPIDLPSMPKLVRNRAVAVFSACGRGQPSDYSPDQQ